MSEGKDEEKLLSNLKKIQYDVEQVINKRKVDYIDYDVKFKSISRKNISDRDESYTNLLDHFIRITKYRNVIREVHKWIYFWIIMALTASFVVFVFRFADKVDFSNNDYTNNMILGISAMVSFCSVIISVPLIITKYLFSSKEDKRIAKIILHTQQHDLDGKRILEGINEKLDRLERGESNKGQDDVINKIIAEAQRGGINWEHEQKLANRVPL